MEGGNSSLHYFFTKKTNMNIKLTLPIKDQLTDYERVSRHWKSKPFIAPKIHTAFKESLFRLRGNFILIKTKFKTPLSG